jgi:hypothetical protein
MNLEEITLRGVTTVAGAVLVIELMLELFVKPAMKNLPTDYQVKWGRLTCNVAAFAIGLAATMGAGHLVGLTAVADAGQMVLVSLAASSMATAGYEVVANMASGAGGGRRM